MRRVIDTPRQDWAKKVEDVGLIYHHTADGGVYWNESAHYELSRAEAETLYQATTELQKLCLEAAQYIIDKRRYSELHIPEFVIPLIEKAWNEEPPAVYGRMDLAYDGKNHPKLLEYNADTPTALLEAAVVQWYWLKDKYPDADQFNSIHEALVAKWQELKPYLTGDMLHVMYLLDQTGEDLMTATYIEQTAQEAGLVTSPLLLGDLGWDSEGHIFVDEKGSQIQSAFKLYPWEWLVHEEFAPYLVERQDVQWLEPIWKMLWSNKGILPILWELFPNHPNLLPAYTHQGVLIGDYVKKPYLSREGANITIHRAGETDVETEGDYGEEGYVYQALAPIQRFDGRTPIIGSWVVDGQSVGIGIRESIGPVTNNTSQFVPHLF